jgi:hypothetical protein
LPLLRAMWPMLHRARFVDHGYLQKFLYGSGDSAVYFTVC